MIKITYKYRRYIVISSKICGVIWYKSCDILSGWEYNMISFLWTRFQLVVCSHLFHDRWLWLHKIRKWKEEDIGCLWDLSLNMETNIGCYFLKKKMIIINKFLFTRVISFSLWSIRLVSNKFLNFKMCLIGLSQLLDLCLIDYGSLILWVMIIFLDLISIF